MMTTSAGTIHFAIRAGLDPDHLHEVGTGTIPLQVTIAGPADEGVTLSADLRGTLRQALLEVAEALEPDAREPGHSRACSA